MADETNDRGALHFIHSNNRIQYVKTHICMPYKTWESEITQEPGKNVLERVTNLHSNRNNGQ